jgi:hypothetical protein
MQRCRNLQWTKSLQHEMNKSCCLQSSDDLLKFNRYDQTFSNLFTFNAKRRRLSFFGLFNNFNSIAMHRTEILRFELKGIEMKIPKQSAIGHTITTVANFFFRFMNFSLLCRLSRLLASFCQIWYPPWTHIRVRE